MIWFIGTPGVWFLGELYGMNAGSGGNGDEFVVLARHRGRR